MSSWKALQVSFFPFTVWYCAHTQIKTSLNSIGLLTNHIKYSVRTRKSVISGENFFFIVTQPQLWIKILFKYMHLNLQKVKERLSSCWTLCSKQVWTGGCCHGWMSCSTVHQNKLKATFYIFGDHNDFSVWQLATFRGIRRVFLLFFF